MPVLVGMCGFIGGTGPLSGCRAVHNIVLLFVSFGYFASTAPF